MQLRSPTKCNRSKVTHHTHAKKWLLTHSGLHSRHYYAVIARSSSPIIKTYRRHKKLYYNSETNKWITQEELNLLEHDSASEDQCEFYFIVCTECLVITVFANS